MTTAENSLRAKHRAHLSWARTIDRTARTAPARRAFEQRFLTEAGGDPVRAESLRKAYFAELAYKSARARRRRGAMDKRETTRPGDAR
ncbi:hypothetical protein H7I53_13620 [Mycolicibacterium pulveris]|uniref:Uncharacterized protein n=1 Tax=Mycolicibacterium pulveris TaxID=36813 RepID=A0A7I7ULW3_MYCPV|nr:hypothetical protein [Mycolicibacterium pulveris]MCV6981261.1 hypothetical protein [Mycolicibacterium pulveris]BBY82297.1 hypothetical protein MPUL_34550 [Mycolicibacterium pulveris]